MHEFATLPSPVEPHGDAGILGPLHPSISQLQRIELEQTAFGAVVCERDPEVVGLDKDSFYQVACAQLGIPPADSVAIEDTATGVASASKAGMGFVVAVPTFLTQRQDFLSQGADIVVSSLAVLCSETLSEWLSVLAGVPTDHQIP